MIADFLHCHRSSLTSQYLLRCLLMPLRRIGPIRSLSEVSCRKITGRALSQKKDPSVQLISAQKSRNSKDSEVPDKKLSAINHGPMENSHVANYRMALAKFPLSLRQKKWSKTENEGLAKGIKQQFQEMLLQLSVDRLSVAEGSSDTNGLDNIFASIKDLEITPEMTREFLPKVNWNQLASMYVEGRSGEECEARWLNCEDPLINRNPWTVEEEKSLLLIIQEKGITDWFDIALSLGTNRTPFQCLARYQRSLNACILKREWTEEEDEKLRIAVETFGESNWQAVASTLKGRTGTQCSNRWYKTLHPMRQRVGRWTSDEDKRLTVATMLFGPRNWKKIAQFVPGRTQVQCRERWVNSLDPSVNRSEWTEEEDLRLEAAIEEHGFCWSKVAAALPSRTDNQCWRRWKALHPHEVPLLQAARKIQKAALISNFVDREQERPALGPNDFLPLAMKESASQPETLKSSQKHKRKSRKLKSANKKDACDGQKMIKCTRTGEEAQVCSEQFQSITDDDEIETFDNYGAILRKTVKPASGKKKINPGPDAANASSRRGSRKKESCMQLDEVSKSHQLRPPEKKRTTRDDENLSMNGINKALQQGRRRRRRNELSGECQGVGDVSCQQTGHGTSKFKNRLEASDGDDVQLACFLHKRSKKRRLEVPKITDQVCVPAQKNMESLLLSESVGQHRNENQLRSQVQNDEAHTCCNGEPPKDVSLCHVQSSNLKDKQTIVDGGKVCASEDMAEGGFIKCNEPVLEPMSDFNLEDDNITLACFQNRLSSNKSSIHLKHKQNIVACDKDHGRGVMFEGTTITPHEVKRKPTSNNLESDVDADVTLACLFNKLKKR